MVGHLLQQAGEVELAGDGAVDLEDAGQAVLADGDAVGGGGGDQIPHRGGADGLPPGIVPEDLAQIAGEALGDLLQHGERGLAVVAGLDGLAGRDLDLGPRVVGAPDPVLLAGGAGGLERLVVGLAGGGIVAGEGRDLAAGEEEQRAVRGGRAEQDHGAGDLPGERDGIGLGACRRSR